LAQACCWAFMRLMSFLSAPGKADGATGASMEESGASWQSALGSFARMARATLQVTPQEDALTEPLALASEPPNAPPDVEMGGMGAAVTGWMAQAQQGLSQGLEKAKSVEWGEQLKGAQGSLSRSFSTVSESAASASGVLQDRVSQGVERAKSFELGEHTKGMQRSLSRGFETVADGTSSVTSSVSSATSSLQDRIGDVQMVQSAKEGASAAAGAAKGALSVAGERASSAAALAMDPQKLKWFLIVFMTGSLFILFSLYFLPALLFAPQRFALLFTLGSSTMLSSFLFLSGPWAFISQLAKPNKLPFSSAYVVGVIGTFWATLIRRSYIFTSLFAMLQALALLYLVCSHFPGGRAGLNMLGRLGGRSVRSLALG